MALTQADISRQMIAQLRVLDPSVSADIGTPERKIIDTVAQVAADLQIDLVALSGALDLDSKSGSNLDKFLGLFGFARQKSTPATGVVTFSRTTAAASDIRIPAGTQIATAATGNAAQDVNRITFVTTTDVVLSAGSTSVQAPIQAAVAGTTGNVAANTIQTFVSTPLGITGVTNPAATTGGVDSEDDDAFKVRFKNTVFRNVSGTADQYLALAAATAFTTKANVVGPISRYREYIQVPTSDDSSDGNNGVPGKYTSALSTIPYSKHTYTTLPVFVSNGDGGTTAIFYVQDLDFTLNAPAFYHGDAYRQGTNPTSYPNQPNVTFLTVLPTGASASIQGVRAGDIVLFEHSYMSSESRNDFTSNIFNCVDVFIDGVNEQQANVVIPLPSTVLKFNSTTTDKLYTENYRRVGTKEHRPVAGNYFSPMLFQPAIDVPDTLTVNGEIYTKGIHYWAVEDTSSLAGTVRARNGIEWAATVPGQLINDSSSGPYTGHTINANTGTSISVDGYTFDKNVIDLQSAFEGSKQIATDVLAHSARKRYFKLDVTVMYTPGASSSTINLAVQSALETFFSGQYFGTTIQLSDLLQVIHNVAGIDNVRWTYDVDTTKNKVTECSADGTPRHSVVVDRRTAGTASSAEIQSLYLPVTPTSGTFTITWNGVTTAAIAYNASSATINSALSAAGITAFTITSGSGTAASPWLATFASNGWQTNLIQTANTFVTSTTTLNKDFFLKDNQLPDLPDLAASGDTLAGLVIRPRAQNTWMA